MAQRARPTLRCLREDLALPAPRVDTPLEEISHPLLAKAAERFADDQTPQERIAAIDDQVLFKTYVAIRIIGSVPRRLVATILSLIPGCQPDAWMSDYAMPERAVAPKNRSGRTSWTPPPQRNSSTNNHKPPRIAGHSGRLT